MALNEPAFDRYLARMARAVSTADAPCRAVLPDVDGGLLLVLEAPEKVAEKVAGTFPGEVAGTFPGEVAGTAAERQRVVKAQLQASGSRGLKIELISEDCPPGLQERLERFCADEPHPLLDYSGRELEALVLDRQVELEPIWSARLQPGQTRWGSFVLQRLEPGPGALLLGFSDGERRVELQLTDGADPRLQRAERVLRIGHLALSAPVDERGPAPPAGEQVERFVAYLIAHSSGPATRIRARRPSPPSVSLYGRPVTLNPFLPEGRQGASGMSAALFGRPRQHLKVVACGDASCRQTFPPAHRLRLNDTWSYFPVRSAPAPGDLLALDFGERDVVAGVEQRLVELVRALERDDPELRLALIQTCVSRLIGDDLAGVLDQELAPGRWVVLNPDFQARRSAVDALVWQWLLGAFAPDSVPEPRADSPSVNLVGLGQRELPATAELLALLAELGVEVAACLFPSFDEAELGRLPAAAATVASSCNVVQNAFRLAARSRPDPPWHWQAPPFGIAATRRWLAAVLRAAGRDPTAAAETTAGWAAACRARLDTVCRPLRGEAVALVAAADFSAFMFDPRESFGIPLLDLFAELGLAVELFVHGGRPPPELEALARRDGVRLTVLQDPTRVRDAVRASPARLLLSSVRRNRDALALGKLPLFVHAFEMGFAGALRSAERLVLACRSDWPARAGEVLGR
jgi:hypothetical protein